VPHIKCVMTIRNPVGVAQEPVADEKCSLELQSYCLAPISGSIALAVAWPDAPVSYFFLAVTARWRPAIVVS
jgi:hypothetical protein